MVVLAYWSLPRRRLPPLLLAAHCLNIGLLTLWPVANAQTVGIVCYGVGGQSYVNNTRCPGSNACCGVGATCLSNRLCHLPGDAPEVWVRGPCAVTPFDESCAQICYYNETEIGEGVLPRVTPCADGSLCCNNDPQCCADGRGIFLDENGNRASTKATAAITSYPPVGTGTDRYTQTPSLSTTIPPTSLTPSPSGTDVANAGSTGENTALKVGLGVGMAMTVVLTALVVYFWLTRRKRSRTKADGARSRNIDASVLDHPDQDLSPTVPSKKQPGSWRSPVAELGSAELVELDPAQVSELPVHHPRYELDSSTRKTMH